MTKPCNQIHRDKLWQRDDKHVMSLHSNILAYTYSYLYTVLFCDLFEMIVSITYVFNFTL